MNSKEEKSVTKDVVDAATGLVKAIPLYQDSIQPAAKEVGKALETVAKTVNVALAPVGALVWSYEQIKDFVSTQVTKKLSAVDQHKIITPNPAVAGPALEALRYTGNESCSRDMFANLIASSMHENMEKYTHPSFVEVIKQLSPYRCKTYKRIFEKWKLPRR